MPTKNDKPGEQKNENIIKKPTQDPMVTGGSASLILAYLDTPSGFKTEALKNTQELQDAIALNTMIKFITNPKEFKPKSALEILEKNMGNPHFISQKNIDVLYKDQPTASIFIEILNTLLKDKTMNMELQNEHKHHVDDEIKDDAQGMELNRRVLRVVWSLCDTPLESIDLKINDNLKQYLADHSSVINMLAEKGKLALLSQHSQHLRYLVAIFSDKKLDKEQKDFLLANPEQASDLMCLIYILREIAAHSMLERHLTDENTNLLVRDLDGCRENIDALGDILNQLQRANTSIETEYITEKVDSDLSVIFINLTEKEQELGSSSSSGSNR